MNNKQNYYYIIFIRTLLVLYLFIYSASVFDHFDILYNKDVALYLIGDSQILGVIPNILNEISGSNAKYVLILVFFIAPLILFRSTSFFAAISIWYIEVCFLKLNPFTNNIGAQTLLMILLITAFARIPYKKTEENANETNIYTSKLFFLGLWINFALYYFYSGYTKLLAYGWYSGKALILIDNHIFFRTGLPHEIYTKIPDFFRKVLTYFVAFAELLVPFALFNGKAIMKIIWWAIFILQLGLLFFMNLFSVQLIMLIFSLMVYNPEWGWGGKSGKDKIQVYYDGYCALCHTFVMHIINIDTQDRVYFKPIQETNYYSPGSQIGSILVLKEGKMLEKSDAIIFLYSKISRFSHCLALLLRLFPKVVRDRLYDFIAQKRYTVFGRKENVCPVIKEDLAYKFL